MVRRWWKWLLAIGLVPLLLWGCDTLTAIDWVGSTDLAVEFMVTELGSGNPLSGARVEVQSKGGFYEEPNNGEFVLSADTSGVARKECRNNTCFGIRSGLGFRDTFAVHLPWWNFRVSAPGFQPSEWFGINESAVRHPAHRTGPGKAKLVVPVALHRRSVEPGPVP